MRGGGEGEGVKLAVGGRLSILYIADLRGPHTLYIDKNIAVINVK